MAARKKGKEPFREIQARLQKRDYKGALGWFQTLLEKEKKNTQIRLRYADTLVLAGSKNEAIKQYRIVADELAESGFMIRAIAINKKIVQLDPRQSDVHQKLAAQNEARSKGRSAAMAQLASAITSDPAMDGPPSVESPPPTEPSPPPTSKEAEPPATPTMSLEDSLAMEFGESAHGSRPPEPSAPVEEEPVEEIEISTEEEQILEPIEEEEAPVVPTAGKEEEIEIVLDSSSPPGLAQEEPQEFEIVSDEEGAPSFSQEPVLESEPTLESEEDATERVLESVAEEGEEGEEGPEVEFEIETEPEAAADGAAPLVGILGEDIDSLIDSIIDDVGSSAGGAPPPPPPAGDTPGGIPLFSQLTMQEFIDVAVVLDRRSVAVGTVIVKEGDPGDSMFIVSTGEVDATVEEDGGPVKVASFHDGDFFGEMAVLSGEPRTATVTAAKNTELLELSRENLLKIFSKHPEVEAKIRLAYDERAMNDPK
jgi:hypothetical protein